MAIDLLGSDRGSCIVCEERAGTISTLDGPVCPACMPEDLLPRAAALRRHNIVSYLRTHRGCRTCASCDPAPSGPTVSPDRSMAITLSDSVVLADELNARISESDGMDMVVSFIKMSGLNLILDSLRGMCARGRLRVITTAYMGATELEAVDTLIGLPNTEVRMELDADRSRLHAKCFIFHGTDGRETAYVGSANISRTALTSGEEWVVKLRREDVPQVLDDLGTGYDALWASEHLRPVGRDDRAAVESALESRGMIS